MKIFADTASLSEIEELDEHPWVSGFTTNPTLAKNAGVTKYGVWAKEAVALTTKPISIDGPCEKVWGLGPNAIPKVVTVDTDALHERKRPVNLTAICHRQWLNVMFKDDIISVFAGRIMDTGRDPKPVIKNAIGIGAQVLWASTRELYHYVLASQAGCDIITMAPALIAKLPNLGKPLEVVAEETRAMFEADRQPW